MKVSGWAMLVVSMFVVCDAFASSPGDVSVFGEIESKTGFRFSDGSSQVSAADGMPYAQTIVVAKSGGAFTRIQAAIDSIENAGPDNRFLIRVAPGVYIESVVLKPFVHLQGAGRTASRILLYAETDSTAFRVTENSMVSSFGISCGGLAGISCTGLASEPSPEGNGPVIQDVAIEVATSRGGLAVGIGLDTSLPGSSINLTLRDVSIIARGGAENIGIHAVSGVAWLDIIDSIIEAVATSVTNDNRAIQMDSGKLRLASSRVRAEGGSSCHGLYLAPGTTSDIEESVVSGWTTGTGSSCRGIEVRGQSDLTVQKSTIEVNGGDNQYGIRTVGASGFGPNLRVRHSTIRAVDHTVYNDYVTARAEFHFTHFEGGSVLEGIDNTVCLFSTDDSLNTFAEGCP